MRRGDRVIFETDPPPAEYYVYLSRFTNRPYTDVWPIGLRDRLPVLPVPLLPPDEDVVLGLQRAVDACYDLVRYERLLDYTAAPPPPPLSEADAAWVAERLAGRAAGGCAPPGNRVFSWRIPVRQTWFLLPTYPGANPGTIRHSA